MPSHPIRKPHWFMLSLILLLALGGLTLEHWLHLTPLGHKVTLLLIIAAIYGLMGLWVKANGPALQELDAAQAAHLDRDRALYAAQKLPTRMQSNVRDSVSYFRGEAPEKRAGS